MFGIDFEALILLALLAFILFGPEKLPEYAGKLGYYLAKLRAASAELTQQAQASFNNPLQPPPPQPGIGQPDQTLAGPAGVYERACPVCAQLVSQDFLFCPKCGAHLKEETATPATPESLTT
ncbi:MAG: twin-arginine translocase TatA/TatE family subunit [Desulfobaccales bacterium]